MIMTATELRQHITTDETDQVLDGKLQALELLIRTYTNNNFQVRAFRGVAVAMSNGNQLLMNTKSPFKVGDTLQITESELNAGLVKVTASDGGTLTVKEELYDESGVVITKVVYPMDVKMGVVNLIKWELDNRDKVGVASETISRHSVTYFDLQGDNSTMGFPKSLMGFLKPYIKARFGKGVGI